MFTSFVILKTYDE